MKAINERSRRLKAAQQAAREKAQRKALKKQEKKALKKREKAAKRQNKLKKHPTQMAAAAANSGPKSPSAVGQVVYRRTSGGVAGSGHVSSSGVSGAEADYYSDGSDTDSTASDASAKAIESPVKDEFQITFSEGEDEEEEVPGVQAEQVQLPVASGTATPARSHKKETPTTTPNLNDSSWMERLDNDLAELASPSPIAKPPHPKESVSITSKAGQKIKKPASLVLNGLGGSPEALASGLVVVNIEPACLCPFALSAPVAAPAQRNCALTCCICRRRNNISEQHWRCRELGWLGCLCS